MNLHLLTCTRNRPEALNICAEYISRSTVRPTRWTIIDDGDGNTEHPTVGQTHWLRRQRRANEPAHTLPLNLAYASATSMLDLSGNEVIVFWEDDDWYSPEYLEFVRNAFFDNERLLLFGQQRAPYYRIQAQEWAYMPNIEHSSLCATAMRLTPETLVVFQAACADAANPFVDIRLWNSISGFCKKCIEHPHVVGIKQMPGTPSTTMGWRGGPFFHQDVEGSPVLHKWVGAKDAIRYIGLGEREVLSAAVG